MWPRLTWKDVRVVGHYLGVLVQFSSIAMLIPFIVGILCGEFEPAARYLLGAGVALTVGSLLRFLRVTPARLGRQQALVVTGVAWIVLAFIATVPVYLSGHYATYLDALFDCVSGLTTTGATVVQDLEHLSHADNMFRFTMHFVGGLGLIVVALSLGLFGSRGNAGLYSSEARTEHVVPNVVQTTRFIAKLTVGFVLVATVILSALCLLKGMEPLRAVFHSLWLAISGFVTGGFSPMSQSVMYYHSFPMELVLMILMILGTVSFLVHSEIWNGRVNSLFHDIESKTMLLWLSVMVIVFIASLSASMSFSDLPALLRRGTFMVVSAFSTTGFQNVTTNQLTTVLTSGAFLTLAIVMAVGGGAGSTAGGIKFSRVGILFKSVVATIKEALSPDSARVAVTYERASGRFILSSDVVREAMTVFVLFVITYVIGALVGIAHGYGAMQAIFESVAMTSNGGIITGIVSPGMPASLEIVYILLMWAGRLEFVTFLALVVEIAVSIVPRRRVKKQ